MRRCPKCGQEKPFTADYFPVDGNTLRSTCRLCRAAEKRRNRQANETPDQRQRRLTKAREYALQNAERLAAWRASYREATKDQRSDYDRARYLQRRDEVKARAQLWRRKNPDRKRESNARWAERNPEKAAASSRSAKRKRRRIPAVRLSDAISAGIRQSIQRGKGGLRWQAAVGYSTSDLVAHLERQFLPGMTWDNYGDWHIDHVVPVASFVFDDLDDPAFKACWALTNLRAVVGRR